MSQTATNSFTPEAELIKQRTTRMSVAYFSIMGVPMLGVVTIALGVNPLFFAALLAIGFIGFFVLLKYYVTERVMVSVGAEALRERPKEGINTSERLVPFREIEKFGVVTTRSSGVTTTVIRMKQHGLGTLRYMPATKAADSKTEFFRIADELSTAIDQFNRGSTPVAQNRESFGLGATALTSNVKPIKVGLSIPEKIFWNFVKGMKLVFVLILWLMGIAWVFAHSNLWGGIALVASLGYFVYLVISSIKTWRKKRKLRAAELQYD